MKSKLVVPLSLAAAVGALFFFQAERVSSQLSASSPFMAQDPGVRGGAAGGGGAIAGLSKTETDFFFAGQGAFQEVDGVPEGLGPRMNLDQCSGCHAQPAVGGTSPFVNPQVACASKDGGTDFVPSFIAANGPVREARFVKNPDGTADGGVHDLFTITGRTGAAGCTLAQPDFATQLAHNKSLLLFSGEAYNVEQGITNELFQTERDETPSCQFATTPNDFTHTDALKPLDAISDIEKFAFFMRFLAAPTPSPDTPGGATSIANGKSLFSSIGCALCHTPTLSTRNTTVAALRNQPVNLFSDLLVHDMGVGLADGVSQGQAGPREFRSAPLWGLGQRIFFLHDGRTSDLLQAIQAHQSGSPSTGDASEANAVIKKFNSLKETQKQDILNFLRSL